MPKSRLKATLDYEQVSEVSADVDMVTIERLSEHLHVPRFENLVHKPKFWEGSIVTEQVNYDTTVKWGIVLRPQLWGLLFRGNSEDLAYDVLAFDGDIFTVGVTNSFGSGGYDVIVVRTDDEGNFVWAKAYGGSGNDDCSRVKQYGQYLVIVGSSDSFQPDDKGAMVIVLDKNGNLIWSKILGVDNYPYFTDLVVDNNYMYVTGYQSPGVFLVKMDGSGNVAWAKTYGSNDTDEGYGLAMLGDDIIVAGSTVGYNLSKQSTLVMSTNVDGALLWAKAYYYSQKEDWANVVRCDDNYIFVGGTSLLKLSSDGSLQFAKRYSLFGNEYTIFDMLIYDDNILLAASYLAKGLLISIDKDGNVIWAKSYEELHPWAVKGTNTFLLMVGGAEIYVEEANEENDMFVMNLTKDGESNLSNVTVADVTSDVQVIDITPDITVNDVTGDMTVNDITSSLVITDITSQLAVIDVTSQLNVTTL